MKKQFTISLTMVFLMLGNCLFAQLQKPSPPTNHNPQSVDMSDINLERKNQATLPKSTPSVFDQLHFDFQNLPLLQLAEKKLNVRRSNNNSLPVWIKGTPKTIAVGARTVTSISQEYLNSVKGLLQIKNPEEEFEIQTVREDEDGVQHIRLQQYFQGLKVYGAEIILHEKDDAIHLFNGRYYPTANLEDITPQLTEEAAMDLVQSDVSDQTTFKDLPGFEEELLGGVQLEASLLIYHKNEKAEEVHLAWHVTARPNIISRWEYFVDAQTGAILHKYNNICQIHGGRCAAHPNGHDVSNIQDVKLNSSFPIGAAATTSTAVATAPPPTTANATDLLGVNRIINVYQESGTFFMIDASRSMFNAGSSNIPNEPIGAIWTIDGNNDSPENSSFQASHVTSSNNNWNNATSVSAHYNGGLAYEYFKNTFNRNSINGQGGNIVSIINITESNGADMDNAFWNGQAMFYGNGDQAFDSPLAKGLDVAGHEMAHGVIQGTANLNYQNESGAMNESFADIFGAMIDRDDWQIGEDIANNSVFPTGAMRDMSNPHNGGNSSDFYWQPNHYDERYTGSQDNGGVHINSGIVNFAFFKIASNSSVGKANAEQIYYKVLRDYLVASSKFIDLRNAVVEVAGNDFGQSVADIAANAFEEVGIGAGPGTTTQTDAGVNPGDEFILWSDIGLDNINNVLTDGTPDGGFTSRDHLSKPSISDDGRYLEFVGDDNNIWEVEVDWSNGSIVSEQNLTTSGMWRTVAISKDGLRIAAVNTNFDNTLWVYDFGLGTSQTFELYNPTFTQGVTTGDVDYADVLEFDISGEYVMYDAQSSINSDFGDDISYWDIGFIRVWNNQASNWGDGEIQKLFSGLPENISVGNPTFSKNSPYIIAFDLIDATGSSVEYSVRGINLETSDQGVIWENDRLGYPNYSTDDTKIVFTGTSTDGNSVIAVNGLSTDKINASGDPSVVIDNATWGVWYATGDRNLMIPTYEVGTLTGDLQTSPNPFGNELRVVYESTTVANGAVSVFDLMGKQIYFSTIDLQFGQNEIILPLKELARGTYLLQLKTAEGILAKKIVKGME
ncbi:MAG: Zn-dependent metalloprotease [Polaribacter sp.]|jgi:Zn-dependent metalloprotease